MAVKKKDIKAAIYRLKIDNHTPIEVINFIEENVSSLFITPYSPPGEGDYNKKIKPNLTDINNRFILKGFYPFTSQQNIKYILLNQDLLKELSIIGNSPLNNDYLGIILSYSEMNEVVKNIADGTKLQAVKSLKELNRFGLDLKKSKDLIDYMAKNYIF